MSAMQKLIQTIRDQGGRGVAIWESFPGRYVAGVVHEVGENFAIRVRSVNDHPHPSDALDDLETAITPPPKLYPCPHCGHQTDPSHVQTNAKIGSLLAKLSQGPAAEVVAIDVAACPKCAGLVRVEGEGDTLRIAVVTEEEYVAQCRKQFADLQNGIRAKHAANEGRKKAAAAFKEGEAQRPASPSPQFIQRALNALADTAGNAYLCSHPNLIRQEVDNHPAIQLVNAFVDRVQAGHVPTWDDLNSVLREGMALIQSTNTSTGA